MKTSKTLALFIIVCVISASALMFSFFAQQKTDAPFTIAITKAHAKLFENYKALSANLSKDVAIEIYDNEADLMKAVYSGSVDAYSINIFGFLKQFADLPKGKAILGLPSEYYLIANQTGDIERPKIGIFDEMLTFYMLKGVKYTTILYSETAERLQALNDGLIDYAIISSADYVAENTLIVKKMSNLGYNEDVFVLTQPWIESDLELGLNIVEHLSKILTLETKAPDEATLMKAMSELFKDEKIPTRYYYKDLVYFEQP